MGEQVLVVVDIDNTLLAMNQDLGSDQWFTWQDELVNSAPQSPDLVASDFSGLLDVQGTLFALSEMHSPEPDLPKLIREIQALNVTTVVLTSRGYNYRDAAERELARNGYDFSTTSLEIEEQRGLFLPFDPDAPGDHGLTEEMIERIQSRISPVTYSNGIFMTAVQHKGYMLRTLLSRANPRVAGEKPRAFKAIVFVDDHEKHTNRMHEAYEGVSLHLVTYRYSREDGNVSHFNHSSKRQVVQDWERLRDFIDTVFVK